MNDKKVEFDRENFIITNEQKIELAQNIVTIAKKAGSFIVNTEIHQITEKGDASNVVTDIDVKCQQYIIKECLNCIPQSSFLAEEDNQQQVSEKFTWVVDPIDGTTNYMYEYQHSCISIALYYQMKGIIGVVYNPYLDECFVGIEDIGSYCNGKEIHTNNYELNESLIMVGTSPYDKTLADKTFEIIKKLFLEARDIRRSGSAALDLCYLACGRIDAFYEHILQPWDYGAGSIIVRNAGGVIESITENALNELKPTGLICSNGKCHNELRNIVLNMINH